jgi:hypothetical protein
MSAMTEQAGPPRPIAQPQPYPQPQPIAGNSPEVRELTIVYRPTLTELVHLTAAMNRGGFFANGFGGFSATAVVLVLLAGAPLEVVLPPAVFAILLLSGYWSAPLTWFIASRRRDLLLAPTTMTLDDGGISFENANMKARHDWSVYRRARDLGRAILLEAGPGLAAMIPTSSISDGAALREILSRHGLVREPTPWERTRPFAWLALGAAAFVVQAAAQGMVLFG